MTLALKRKIYCLYSTSLLVFIVIMLFCKFFEHQLTIYAGRTGNGLPQMKILPKPALRIHTKDSKLDLGTEGNVTPSPFINPVFHINISRIENDHDILILFWESPGWFKNWSLSTNMKHCLKYTNCRQSFDRSLLNVSQAIVFNLPYRITENKPPVATDLRNPNQAWVFFTLESPLHINFAYNTSLWHNVFNWSWTYHPNADIFHPYGLLVKRQKTPYRNYTEIFKMKTKFAAWAVSNCGAPSKRNEFVNILKRYVDVDVFGWCGQPAPENLETILNEKYKFYLGFENSLCNNYFTEKFFYYYTLDVITVLRGKTKYRDFLPNGSYIDTANFSSVVALAQFMKDLGENEEKYTSYLKVKDEFTVYQQEFVYKDAVCNLCEKLNNIKQNRRVYGDVFKWLGQCYEATDLIENSNAL